MLKGLQRLFCRHMYVMTHYYSYVDATRTETRHYVKTCVKCGAQQQQQLLIKVKIKVMGFTPEEKEVKSTIKRWGLWIIGIVIVLSIGGSILNRAGMFADKILDPDKAIATYENFYQMHEQADQICNDIYIMQNADSLSGGFSKE